MYPTLVINVVGLTPALMGADTPHISRFAARGAQRPLKTVTPAVTCSAQATFLTGLPPEGHGAVGNGWLFRDLMEVWLWRQSNKLLSGERSVLHLRQPFLVVRHGVERGPRGHAAADL
jgi:predicted AlkP superfamily pyrophosphatase or phosphodiesterase